MIKNIYEFNNKLAALKIPGSYIGCRDHGFYIDHYINFEDHVTINKIKLRLNDLCFMFGCPVDIVIENNNIIIRETKQNRDVVNLAPLLRSLDNNNCDGLPVVFGRDDNNNILIKDLCEMPHMLVAGATRSGKSVFLHNVIFSLLATCKTKLVLIDCKRVEFSLYDGIGGAVGDNVIYDAKKASNKLKSICEVMDQRYIDMQKNHCRNFEEYQKIDPNSKYIAVVIDEVADLFIDNRKILEKYIIRIAQLGRAAGIHLILATQRPSAEILSGLIRDNVPTRVCFNVQDGVASRIILDCKGGENLRGRGDGFLKFNGDNKLTRFQAAYMSTDDIIKSLEFYKNAPIVE